MARPKKTESELEGAVVSENKVTPNEEPVESIHEEMSPVKENQWEKEEKVIMIQGVKTCVA